MAERIRCQVCGRQLVPRADGTSRHHFARRKLHVDDDRDLCSGSGQRLARWHVGQNLQHHSGSRWVVDEDIGGRWGDYLIRCTEASPLSPPDTDDREGRTVRVHGEYLHRHGWVPISVPSVEEMEASSS